MATHGQIAFFFCNNKQYFLNNYHWYHLYVWKISAEDLKVHRQDWIIQATYLIKAVPEIIILNGCITVIVQVKNDSMLKHIFTKVSFQHQQERSSLSKNWEKEEKITDYCRPQNQESKIESELFLKHVI